MSLTISFIVAFSSSPAHAWVILDAPFKPTAMHIFLNPAPCPLSQSSIAWTNSWASVSITSTLSSTVGTIIISLMFALLQLLGTHCPRVFLFLTAVPNAQEQDIFTSGIS